MSTIKKTLSYLLVAIVVIGGIGYWIYDSSQPGKYDNFAKCLNDKGAVFFGAFWCPHCQNQKKAFGKSFKYVKYIECSTPDGRGQTKECKDKNIEGYPTWDFTDGSRESSEVPFPKLSEKTGCTLPN